MRGGKDSGGDEGLLGSQQLRLSPNALCPRRHRGTRHQVGLGAAAELGLAWPWAYSVAGKTGRGRWGNEAMQFGVGL